ncbi:MAG: hypothetical protein ACLU0O_01495 [Collinsella sp.]
MSSAVVDVSGGALSSASRATPGHVADAGGEVRLYPYAGARGRHDTLWFTSKDERAMFDRLVSVSGVGPRLAPYTCFPPIPWGSCIRW